MPPSGRSHPNENLAANNGEKDTAKRPFADRRTACRADQSPLVAPDRISPLHVSWRGAYGPRVPCFSPISVFTRSSGIAYHIAANRVDPNGTGEAGSHYNRHENQYAYGDRQPDRQAI